jgi:hypothetical protein
MAKKKVVNKESIISLYMAYVLDNEKKPHTVYQFSKAHNFDEQEFYKFFASFEVLEKHVFNAFFENTVKALSKSVDYTSFDARNKLLSFYYTFFENLSANRSYVIQSLENSKTSLKGLKLFSSLKDSFTQYIDELDIEMIDVKQKQIQEIQRKALKESAWMQLLMTMKFWMDDTSASFEKTDVFIEKSVNTSFDVLQVTPLKSVIDLGKFLFKEKMN